MTLSQEHEKSLVLTKGSNLVTYGIRFRLEISRNSQSSCSNVNLKKKKFKRLKQFIIFFNI